MHSFLLHDNRRVGVVRWLEVVPAIASLWHPTLVSSTLEARLIHHLVKATLLEIVSALHHHLTVSVLHVLALAGGLLLYTKGVIRFVLHDISLISLRQGFLWLTHQKLC